uniref:Uncharacterized protein n=1 Tax=Arundo donax TaxID=35708 RepID=A0A0A9GLN7_ARUDO
MQFLRVTIFLLHLYALIESSCGCFLILTLTYRILHVLIRLAISTSIYALLW